MMEKDLALLLIALFWRPTIARAEENLRPLQEVPGR